VFISYLYKEVYQCLSRLCETASPSAHYKELNNWPRPRACEWESSAPVSLSHLT